MDAGTSKFVTFKLTITILHHNNVRSVPFSFSRIANFHLRSTSCKEKQHIIAAHMSSPPQQSSSPYCTIYRHDTFQRECLLAFLESFPTAISTKRLVKIVMHPFLFASTKMLPSPAAAASQQRQQKPLLLKASFWIPAGTAYGSIPLE
jgi:hypothetical protein